jgi:hypothetical protein
MVLLVELSMEWKGRKLSQKKISARISMLAQFMTGADLYPNFKAEEAELYQGSHINQSQQNHYMHRMTMALQTPERIASIYISPP